MGYEHRRRIKTEEKAKVVTDVWGTEYMKKKDELHQDDLKKGMYSSYSLYRPSAIVVNKQTEWFATANTHPEGLVFPKWLTCTAAPNGGSTEVV